MNLLIDNTRSDKDTTHSYLPVYEQLFHSKKDHDINIMEIGICHGGSIQLWYDYFKNGIVYGLDILPKHYFFDLIKDRTKIFPSTDAYDLQFIDKTFKDVQFDFIIDDGPHTLGSMIFSAEHYSKLLKDDGILVIEDVQSMNWIPDIIASFPAELRQYVEVIDLRSKKGRYDDIMVVLNKSKK
jgi:hypothetical protein